MDNGDFHFSLSTRTHTCGIRDFVEQIPGGWHARSQKEIARNAAESPRFPVKESTLKMCVCVCVCASALKRSARQRVLTEKSGARRVSKLRGYRSEQRLTRRSLEKKNL